MPHNIFFIKTPKCATETIAIYLRKYAEFHNLKVNSFSYQKFFELDNFNINTNHLFSDKKTFDHFLKSCDVKLPIIKISSIREPLQRFFSNYRYSNQFSKDYKLDFNEWYLTKGYHHDPRLKLGWSTHPFDLSGPNFISRYMGVKRVEELKDKFDFVFVSERFDESLVKFGNILEYKFEKVGSANVYNSKETPYVFSEEVVKKFNEINSLDLEIYNYFYEKLSEQNEKK